MSSEAILKPILYKIIKGAPINGFNLHTFQGPQDIKKARVHTFFGLYPYTLASDTTGVDYTCVTLVDKKFKPPRGMQKHIDIVKSKILELNSVDGDVNLQANQTEEVLTVSRELATLGIIPIAFLGFGQILKESIIEDVVLLWHYKTFTLPYVLNIMKSKLRIEVPDRGPKRLQ